MVNHRSELGADGDYVQAGAYYRGNRDHFSIPLFGPATDSRHQTVVRGAALDGRQSLLENTAVRYGAGVVDDDLDSNTLNTTGPGNGRFMSRTQAYGLLACEQTFPLAEKRYLVATAGARYDDSNREGGEGSPLASVEFKQAAAPLRRVHLSYSESTQLPTYQALNASPAAGALFRGDRDLPRATAQNIELGAELSSGGWTTQAAVFYRADENLLDYVFDPTALTGPASGRSAKAVDLDTLGFELFAIRTWERVELFAGYTYLHKDDNYTAPLDGSFYALNYAEHRFTLGGIARLGAGLELRADNELRRQAENPLRRNGRDNVDTAVGLFYHVPGMKGLVLNVQVENLWDTDYQDVPLVPHTPRTWSAGATYVW